MGYSPARMNRRTPARFARFTVAVAVVTLLPGVARAELPTLERTVQLARARALTVLDAQAEVGVAGAQMAGARASAIGNPYTDIQIDHGLASGQQLQALSYTYVPVDAFGQRGARVDEAEKLIHWRRLGVLDARALSAGEAISAYGAFVVASQRVVEATGGEQIARDEAKYFAGRLEAKDTTIYERALADAEVARWVQQRAEAELSATSARVRLAQVTGTPSEDDPPKGVALLPPALRAAWDDAHVAKVVQRSPLLARASAEHAYWDASAERYRTERVPPLSLELIGGRGAAGEARVGGGLVVTFPITRRYQGEIARAEAGKAQVEQHVPVYRNLVAARVRAARQALATVTRAVTELDAAGLPALETAVSASQEGYRAGKIEVTRVLLARRDLASARSRRLDLLDAAWRAYADLAIFSGDLP
jgi:cobalt-zinc-cadmium efflux system outer membrane protein